MKRDHAIDAFRGLAIIEMIFFTFTLKLSSNLPDPLQHNVWGTLHMGDFVLPMFIFASGLSLAYFFKKREKQNNFSLDVLKRFVKLALVGISLSYFSAYGFLEMDEVMLCALLFIACVLLYKMDWKFIIGCIFIINISYLILIHFDKVGIFSGHYLGGYPAALYYLPIMLTGLIIGKGIISNDLWCKSNKITIATIFLLFIIFAALIPINKLTASPSFIMLSILFSFLIFIILKYLIDDIGPLGELEYIGKNPLRYWLMMYISAIIPLTLYTWHSKQVFPLQIHWLISTVASLLILILFWGVSKLVGCKTISY